MFTPKELLLLGIFTEEGSRDHVLKEFLRDVVRSILRHSNVCS